MPEVLKYTCYLLLIYGNIGGRNPLLWFYTDSISSLFLVGVAAPVLKCYLVFLGEFYLPPKPAY